MRWCRECASRLANLQWPHLGLATACAQSGQLEEARTEAEEVLRINPGFRLPRDIEAGILLNAGGSDRCRVGRCAMAGFQQEA